MVDWHGYIGIENLGFTQSQKATLVTAFGDLGPPSHPQPCCLNHSRARLDGEATIFEALFDQDDLTVPSVKAWLAAIFGVDPVNITHVVVYNSTPVITFTYNSVDRLRMALFGGVSTTRMESRDECAAYIMSNLDEWEESNG